MSLADAKNAEFKSNLSQIKKKTKKNRSKEQKNALYNTKILYKARNLLLTFLMIILQWYLKQNLR